MNTIICYKKGFGFLNAVLVILFLQTKYAHCDVLVDKTGLPVQATNALDMTLQTIIDSTKVKNENAEKARVISYSFRQQKNDFEAALVNILTDTNSSVLNQGTAAYYLGEYHSVRAVDILARKIKFNMDLEVTARYQGLPIVSGFTARDALIKIGAAYVPFAIRNLEESDDALTKKLSLEVLCGIEGEKDIVQLRLEKALKAENDPQKQI